MEVELKEKEAIGCVYAFIAVFVLGFGISLGNWMFNNVDHNQKDGAVFVVRSMENFGENIEYHIEQIESDNFFRYTIDLIEEPGKYSIGDTLVFTSKNAHK